jgi:outer membrane cobalamin receptor
MFAALLCPPLIAQSPSGSAKPSPTQPTRHDQVYVTAYGTPLPASATAASTRLLTRQQLQQSASPALGDALRQVPGVELYRRTSTLIANPTSQGISLRGLGSTSSSRTLVLSDHVPLNDAFGGWIHWEEFPASTIRAVEVVRGGASDLYGSSAIGGVINLLRLDPGEQPQPVIFTLDASQASQNTHSANVAYTWQHGPAAEQWSALLAAGAIHTDGYIPVPQNLRGPVDSAYNAHLENGSAEVRRQLGQNADLFLRGNFYNDARGNGAPLATNATRLWRYASGGDWTTPSAGHWMLRLYGSNEHYRQSFVAIARNRATETLTRLLKTPAAELGGTLEWSTVLRQHLTLLSGVDVHDVRGDDAEVPIANGQPNGLSNTTARQRQTGAYAEALWNWKQWTLSGGLRVDHFSNLDAMQYMQSGSGPVTTTAIPDRTETVVNPRVGLVRRLDQHVALTATAFRAYRAPTIYELYRTGQVGQATTLANPHLLSERATGFETGTQLAAPSFGGTLRLSYFWTEVNRPVTALTLSATPTHITKQRANLGQIRSAGVALDYELHPAPWLSLTGGYQYADAIVTRFDQQPQLIGKWIPEVAHQMATSSLRLSHQHWGSLTLLGRISGRQFDDDVNTYLLHGYFSMDAYAEHNFHRFTLYAAGENLLDRSIDAGRTPVLTLAMPRLVRIGLRLHLAH